MIICFVGKKYSGKSTAATMLRVKYKFEERSFAGKGKEAIAALFGIPVHWVDEYKDPDMRAYVTVHAGDPDPLGSTVKVSMSWREFLQRYFTESAQEHFGRNFWVDFVLPAPHINVSGEPMNVPRDNIVFSDGRFEHELKRVKELGGYNVQILRDDPRQGNDTHAGEQPPPPELIDYIIDNNFSMSDFYDQIDVVLNLILEDKAIENG